MKTFEAVVLCLVVSTVQAVDYDNLVELPIRRAYAAGPSNRITGGAEVVPHSLPYQVGLFIEVDQGTAFCGGSLIAPQWVLTAAHCAEDGKSFEVVLGAHVIRDETEATQVRVVTTDKTVHPEWDRDALRNDVALLRLPEAVNLTAAIQVVRLPSRSQINVTFEGALATESGWGKESDSAIGIATRLQSVDKPVIDNGQCNTRYFGSIDSVAHICTDASQGQSTCNGDSGGPLVIVEDDGKLTQVGAVSFGIIFGCEVGWPAVFARVPSYTAWISNTTSISIRD